MARNWKTKKSENKYRLNGKAKRIENTTWPESGIDPIKDDIYHFNRKLSFLISIEPYNNFYRSMSRQFKNGQLSLKQIRCIEADYVLKKRRKS